MTDPRWARIGALFHRVVDVDPLEWRRILDEECADDPSLRQQIERLLAADG